MNILTNQKYAVIGITIIPLGCHIDGKHFLKLSRNDIAILFPKDDQFVLGMDLFKYIETLRAALPSEGASALRAQQSTSGSMTVSQQPKPSASGVAKRKRPNSSLPFMLPIFELDLELAIKKDAFYNPQKRAKLIRKASEAMAGYCRENHIVPTTDLREELAKTLVAIARKTLQRD